MERFRGTILQMLAEGRIDAAQAERLIAAACGEREMAWVVAGCVAIAGLMQLHWLAPLLAHFFSAELAGGLLQAVRALALLAQEFSA